MEIGDLDPVVVNKSIAKKLTQVKEGEKTEGDNKAEAILAATEKSEKDKLLDNMKIVPRPKPVSDALKEALSKMDKVKKGEALRQTMLKNPELTKSIMDAKLTQNLSTEQKKKALKTGLLAENNNAKNAVMKGTVDADAVGPEASALLVDDVSKSLSTDANPKLKEMIEDSNVSNEEKVKKMVGDEELRPA